ncbi:hypothetical protein ONS95_003588 [Cadophora gregata]|uniref:uncharacterized protein n=1 Tax=Cadophora gregata TaxID=51156 RepID=UPI0026DB969A|nr:uncharacterized protein ONS95_003588 [Cadophora gregata]KAK0106866.1 hypothetical protein ONS95_003588 [Cadophora gregata]
MLPISHHLEQARGSRTRRSLQPPRVHTERPALKLGEVCVGCIVWLPSKDVTQQTIRCINNGCCDQEELNDGGHNHPVVVLKITQKKGSDVLGDLVCTVACVTTFSDTTLSKYVSKRQYKVSSIPIYDAEATPIPSELGSNLIQLRMEEGRLKKQSYVRLQHTYQVPLSMLRQYTFRNSRAFRQRLSEDSYKTLMGLLARTPEKYDVTKTLLETKDRRLLALARSELPPVRRTRPTHQPVRPARIASHSNHYGSYGTTMVDQPIGQYLPPTHTYQGRGYIRRGYTSPGDGSEESSAAFTLVVVIIVIGLLLWQGTTLKV